MKTKTLLILVLLFFAAGSLISCDNDATGQDQSEDVDFIQNIVSGSVIASTQEGQFIIQLELSPVTTFFAENPGFEAGVVNTTNFFVFYDEIFTNFNPNSVLALRENGTAITVPVSLSNPEYDPQTGVVEYTATSLDFTPVTTFSGDSIVSRSIADLDSPFGPAFLFIDSGSLPPFMFNPMGGTCGDGANVVCPLLGPDSDPCINTNPTPQCCNLGPGLTCANCGC
ncbi:MAG: hypothetical protein AAF462_03955 [Thermodesulfobacteriota bacterium]